MKQEKNLCEFDLQDSPDELDKWLCWLKVAYLLEDKFGAEKLYPILRLKGLVDETDNPIIENPKFKHFRSLDVGFTGPDKEWQSVTERCFVTFRGFVKILDIMQKSTSIQLS